MKPIEEVNCYVWLAWNEEDDMWGIVAAGIEKVGMMSATGVQEHTVRRMKPMVGVIARQTETQIKLVKFTFAEVLDEVGG
jgi:hypothetical protein